MNCENPIEHIPPNSLDKPSHPPIAKLHAYKYRYVCLAAFFFAALLNSFSTNTFTASAFTVERLYNQSMSTLALCSLADNLMMPLLVFPASYLLDHVGLKAGLNLAAATMCIGQLLRIYLEHCFYCYVLGTFISSIGSIVMLSAPIKLVSSWFPTNEGPLVSSLLMFGLYASDAFGIFISVLAIDDNSNKQDIAQLVRFEAVLIVVAHMLMAILVKERPKTPANYLKEKKSQSFRSEVDALLANTNYRRLFASLMLLRGTISALFAVFSWVISPYGFGVRADGLIILSSTICGMLGCIIAGNYLRKTRKYRYVGLFCNFSVLLCLGLLALSLEFSGSLELACFLSALLGLFMFPFVSTITELAAECTFPVGEAMSVGCIIAGGELFGFLVGMAFETVLDGYKKEWSRIIVTACLVLIVISGSFLLKVKEDLRKQRFEQQSVKVFQPAQMKIEDGI